MSASRLQTLPSAPTPPTSAGAGTKRTGDLETPFIKYDGTLGFRAPSLRALSLTAHRAPRQAAPQGAHRHALRHAHQHGVRITRALLNGASRASSSRPARGAPACAAACSLARRTDYACSFLNGAARASSSRPTRGAPACAAACSLARRTDYACSSKRRIAHLVKPPREGRTGMRCGMLTSTAYGLRVLF